MHVGTSDSFPLRADLQYSHISPVSPLCPLFSPSLFAGSLALSGVIGARGYRGLPALRGACFEALVSFSWLPVRAGPDLHRPAWSEKKTREGGVCSFRGKNKTKQTNRLKVSVCGENMFLFFLFTSEYGTFNPPQRL